ncbi:unnamed protein product [Pleuronectes platessa]|uniref:Uncharacterized protein n=1 Tax=Pleuronectes platessa TaxID=8262 RepID=A0A9N7VZD2_PLEPL|nr:unnamed protein product [Pleuronectes platessa]
MVQWGQALSTGRGDYIYAGTQVLLNTPSFALQRPTSLCPDNPLFPRSIPLSLRCPSSPLVPSRYKWLFAVQLPRHVVCLLVLVPNSMYNRKNEDRPFSSYTNCSQDHKRLLSGDVNDHKCPRRKRLLCR